MRGPTDLVVPVKNLAIAKSRLRGATEEPADHGQLVLALALDTVAAAAACAAVRRILVVSPDPAVLDAMRAAGTECLEEIADGGLNRALEYGAEMLRGADPSATVGALQADLPALRSTELDAAIDACHAAGHRSFCADREGTGTTLLLAPAGTTLAPRFGAGSAAAHEAQGAVALTGGWPSLRCDVDTPDDLAVAAGLGLGVHTTAALPVGCAR